MWTISSILRKLLGYEYCSMGRLQKVLWGLQAVSFHFSSYFLTERKVQCRLKCLAILYDFISEPYITSAEVGNVAKYLEEKYGWINAKRVREDFEKYFPESKLPYQPRSLQHLCRCTIQQSLRDSGKYPHETTGLPLPRILQKYVAPRKLSDF